MGKKGDTSNWEICPTMYITSLNKTDLRHFLNDTKLKGIENKSILINFANINKITQH